MKKLAGIAILLSQLLLSTVCAERAFVVKKVRVEGLERISTATVESYLPIQHGGVLRDDQTAALLQALYRTGFFEHISLLREGHVLVIRVVERPTIGRLKVAGNSIIPSDKLMAVMKTLGIAEGYVYNPAVLEKIKQSLLNQYYQLGRYNARVQIDVTLLSRHRVFINMTLSEGLAAKVRRISIVGHHAFDEATLVKQLDITTTNLLTFFTQADRYSEEKFDQGLEKLRYFYLDHGYLHFAVKSSQAKITPDRKSVFVTIVVAEGQQYTIKDYRLVGQQVVSREALLSRIHLVPGEVFSRQEVIRAEKEITAFLGEKGYLFATIELIPVVNDQTHQVSLTFSIHPGKRIYVRHISFSDNTRTNDVVLRREVEQWEAAPLSTFKLEQSKQRLSLLPYIREVEMDIKPVPQVSDQVDVNYKVKEDSSAQASLKVGYSQIYRTIIGLGFNQKNFFGTGNTLGVNFTRSKYEQFYGIDYTNPYYTVDGISRSFNFSISRVDPRGGGVNNGYTTQEYNAGVLYGIPVGQEAGVFSRVLAGLGYQNTLVNLADSGVSNQINTFITRHGRHFHELDVKLGFSRDSRDKAIFATQGALQTLFLDTYAPLSSGSLSFYTLNYHNKWYRPLNDQFILTSRVDLGYGSGLHGVRDFPFFKNYYAGGIDSVRGYQGYTLGPRDSNNKPFGGNMLLDGSIGLIFPNYLTDNLRTTAFFDAGNVYSSASNRVFGRESTDTGPLRYSVGIEADWITPFGPMIELSLAQPLNRRPHDQREAFQFALGANF